MSLIFKIQYLFIITSLINVMESKMKNPPIQIWDKTLSEYFSTHSISNYINIESKTCQNNESYYFFVMQTILKFNDTKDEVETLGYTGFCLKEYNISPVEHSLINYYYIWDKSNMNSSSLIEVKKLSQNKKQINDKNSMKFKFFGTLIILYLFFIIIVTIFPKKINDKYNLKELERVKREREEEDSNSNNNIDNINNDNYDNYNLLNIKNDEDKPPADIIVDFSNEKNFTNLSENMSNLNRNSITDENKKEKEKEKKPLKK